MTLHVHSFSSVFCAKIKSVRDLISVSIVSLPKCLRETELARERGGMDGMEWLQESAHLRVALRRSKNGTLNKALKRFPNCTKGRRENNKT